MMNKELNELLKEVNELFKSNPEEKGADTYSFTLSRYVKGFWSFSVIDDWHKWFDKKLETNFIGFTPQEAIINFLKYVKENNINVQELCYKKVEK